MRMVTDDGKWIVDDNVARKTSFGQSNESPQNLERPNCIPRRLCSPCSRISRAWIITSCYQHEVSLIQLYYSYLNKRNIALRQKLSESVNCKSVVTLHVINHPEEIVESSLGYFVSSSVFTGLRAIRLPVAPIATKFFERKNHWWRDACKKSHGEVFCRQVTDVLWTRYYWVSGNTAKDHR